MNLPPDDPFSPNSNDSQKRLLMALGLSFAAVMLYMVFFAPTPTPPEAGAADGGVVAGPADAGVAAPPPGAATPGGTPELTASPTEQEVALRTVERKREESVYLFSNEGAGLTSAELIGPKMREQQHLTIAEGFQKLFGKELPPPPQMNLVRPVPGQPLPLSVSIEGGSPLPANTRWAVAETGEDSVAFSARRGPWEVTKTLQWVRSGFELAYTVQVKNTSSQPLSGELQVHHNRAIDPNFEHAPSFFGGVGNQSRAACHVGEDLHKLVPDDKPPQDTTGPVHYFGIDQQYFLSVFYPIEGPRQGHCTLLATPTARQVTAGFPITVNPGETVTLRFGGWLGPKDPDLLKPLPGQDVLRSAGMAAATWHPTVEKTVDFGIWELICKVLLFFMKFFHSVTGNWGVAIILLTVLVKLVLLPLTYKSMVGMEAVKELQPKMEEIKKKYADDRERMNLEVMKLYQQAKVNPLGGCLPLLIQMPVWIALFTALRNSFDIYWEPFIGPIWRDLTYKDPTYLLPLALGVSMIITQKMQPQMMDAAQARIMIWVMPVIFTLTLLQYPAGLSLYIFTNNLLSIGQQYGLRKWLDHQKLKRGGVPAASGGGKRK
ncbi:membrane protein insertase YidC [Hyalangium minutum]|uniref:Membrane protein insertase YidC n=1 Tax=Hyalangium minutum TaxID=394096 RepID=A0A085WLJ1_9BACT|nr:membrane protein insertase YidC [Hyalangium minutum]KFE68554.1 Inner membrane protein translocase component YidC, long form [Hyalangium minutum]